MKKIKTKELIISLLALALVCIWMFLLFALYWQSPIMGKWSGDARFLFLCFSGITAPTISIIVYVYLTDEN